MSTTAVKERPILFSGPMVRAILDGRKTQTRRVIEPITVVKPAVGKPFDTWNGFALNSGDRPGPFGKYVPGERLWVRETLRQKPNSDFSNSPNAARSDWVYAADDTPIRPNWVEMAGWSIHRSKPSIHMPRWASRITLEIVSVRVERLQEISEADAFYEGVQRPVLFDPSEQLGFKVHPYTGEYRDGFQSLWESINGPGSWDANPWVWVVEFTQLQP